MYTVRVYNNTGATVYRTLLDAKVRSWSNRVNGPGKAVFTLPVGSINADLTTLQKYRMVTIDRRKQDGSEQDQTVWIGYLEAHKRTSPTQFSVFCNGLLGLFRKRYTANNQSFTGQGSTEAFGLLTSTNSSDGDTGVSTSTGTVTATKNLAASGRKDILGMWTDMSMAYGAEFEINTARQFNFVPSLGSDKSGTITLRLRRDGQPGSNILNYEEGEDGEPLANRILATTTQGGGLSYTYNDAASQAIYPVLCEAKEFNEAGDLTALTAMATAYGQQKANPITDNQVIAEPVQTTIDTVTGLRVVSGIQYGDIVPGDLVMCDFVTETQNIQAARRAAEILVDVDDNDAETIRYTLSKSGIYLTTNYIDGNLISDLTRRIQDVERLV